MYEHLLSKWVYTGVRARYLWAKVIISCSVFQIRDGGSCSRGRRQADGHYTDFWGMESKQKGNVGGKENSIFHFPLSCLSARHVMRPSEGAEHRKVKNSLHICFSFYTCGITTRHRRKGGGEEAACSIHTDEGRVCRQVSFLKIILISFPKNKEIPNISVNCNVYICLQNVQGHQS